MKRAVLVVFGVIAVTAAFASWWFLRDTPEKALKDGLTNLFRIKTIQNATLNVTWSDPTSRITTGFSGAGQVDLKDYTRPRALGAIRAGEGFLSREEQTADLVVEMDRFALRPRSVPVDVRKRYLDIVKDAQENTFAIVRRDQFLKERGFDFLVAQGPAADVRAAMPGFLYVARVAGPWKRETVAGKDLVTVPFMIDRAAMKPFLASLAKTWVGDNLTPEELQWVERQADDLALGSYSVTIDRATRLPVEVRAEWPVLGADGKEHKRVRASFAMEGLDTRVTIAIPESSKDVSDAVLKPKTTAATLPYAQLKPLPEASFASGSAVGLESGAYATGTYATTSKQFIDEKDTDLFHKYQVELERSKNRK